MGGPEGGEKGVDCKGFPGAKDLRLRLCQVDSVSPVEDLAAYCLYASLTVC